MKFNPALSVNAKSGGAPNFYGMSIEHISDNTSVGAGRWPGQPPGYAHFIEVDFFETLAGATTSYNSSTHDWGGVYSGSNYPQDIVNGRSNIIAIGRADFTKFHVYGCLWVPQSGSTPGRLQRYFDEVLVQTIYYLGPPGLPPLPTDRTNEYSPSLIRQADRTYSVIDNHRLALLLGGGAAWPIQVDWVKVWK